MKLINVFRITLLTLLVVFSSATLAELVQVVDFRTLAKQRSVNSSSQNFSFPLDIIEPGLSISIDNSANFSELLDPNYGLLVCRGNRGCGADPQMVLGIGEFLQFTFVYQGEAVEVPGLEYQLSQTEQGGILYIIGSDPNSNPLNLETYLEVNFDYSGAQSEREFYITSIFTRIADTNGGNLVDPTVPDGGNGGDPDGGGPGEIVPPGTSVPEPESLLLFAIGLVIVGSRRLFL